MNSRSQPAPGDKRRRFESTVAAVQARHGTRALRPARALDPRPPAVPTGFAALDALIGGVPLRAWTLFSGPSTSGKLTLAYKTLAAAQAVPGRLAAVVALNRSGDPDYLARCGIDLRRLLWACPSSVAQAAPILLDLLRARPLRAVLLDGLPELLADPAAARALRAHEAQVRQALRGSACALIALDEPRPPWQRWWAEHAARTVPAGDLHVELRRERWLAREGELYGYAAQARVRAHRWGPAGGTAEIAIEFNGTVRARETW